MAYPTPSLSTTRSIRRDGAVPLGILSVLADDDKRRILRNPSLLHRKLPSSSSSFAPALKLECCFAKTPAVKRHSAPIDIPLGAGRMDGDGNAGEDETAMVPPHEIVARRWAGEGSSAMPTCMGRALKGRDLRRVRDAVWRQIGFED